MSPAALVLLVAKGPLEAHSGPARWGLTGQFSGTWETSSSRWCAWTPVGPVRGPGSHPQLLIPAAGSPSPGSAPLLVRGAGLTGTCGPDGDASHSVAEPVAIGARDPRTLPAPPSRRRCGESWGQRPAWGTQPLMHPAGEAASVGTWIPALLQPHLLLCLGDLPRGASPILGPRGLDTRACVAGTALPHRGACTPSPPTVHTCVACMAGSASTAQKHATHVTQSKCHRGGPHVPKVPARDRHAPCVPHMHVDACAPGCTHMDRCAHTQMPAHSQAQVCMCASPHTTLGQGRRRARPPSGETCALGSCQQ